MIVRLLVLVLAAIVAVAVVKLVFVVALVGIGICAAVYAYHFLRALLSAVSPPARSPLERSRISVRR